MTNPSHARRALSGLGFVVVAVYTIIDAMVSPLLGPVTRTLLQSPPVEWCKSVARRLSAYPALAFLAVPFVLAEPAKIYGLYLCGDDKLLAGIATIIVAYLVSLLLVDTIYDAARPQLRSIRWFAAMVDWISSVRHRTLAAIRSTRAWREMQVMIARLKRRRVEGS